MQLPEIITNKTKRDDLKEKVEVVFAVLTITAFINKKMKSPAAPAPVPSSPTGEA